jgi:hypothetical protein
MWMMMMQQDLMLGHEEASRKLASSGAWVSLSLKKMTMYSARPPNCIATFRLVINLMHSCGFVNYPTEHFTAPESLSDPVDCPSCRRKTPTKKQHTFAKLPKVLCLHLKRFDAATNKKIDDFVSFPASGQDMGRMLPHW